MKKRKPVSERFADPWNTMRLGLGVTVIVLAACMIAGGHILKGIFERTELEAVSFENRRDRSLFELPLLYRIDRADRITVVNGNAAHQPDPDAEPFFEIRREGLGKEFVSLLWVDAKVSGSQCLCFPRYFANFYENDRLLASVGFSHDLRLRSDAWGLTDRIMDGEVTKDSAGDLADWFTSMGTTFLAQHREWDRQRRDNYKPGSPIPPPPETLNLLSALDAEEPNNPVQETPAEAVAPDL